MARLSPLELLIANLRGDFKCGQREYRPPQEAYLKLKSLTGKDFGMDVNKWSKWASENSKIQDEPKGDLADRLFPT